jgi:hypothetical protein
MKMDLQINRTKTIQKVYVENALILMGLRTGTHTFVYICNKTKKKMFFFFFWK